MLKIVILILAALIVLPSLSRSRQRKLTLIIKDLEKLKAKASPEMQNAIAENITFFRAIKTIPGYIYWALTRRPAIDGQKLLEIADLPLPQWEQELYKDLSHVERKKFPGLLKPLCEFLLKGIKTKQYSTILDLGCGGMEVESQVLSALQRTGIKRPIVFVGVDSAPQAWGATQDTFAEFHNRVKVEQIKSLSVLKNYPAKKPTIFFYRGDALKSARSDGHNFDLVFSSRFRHHLSKSDKSKLDRISQQIPSTVIEYDDFSTAFSWIPPILTAWYRPILLNGAIFSQLRQPSKTELKNQKQKGSDIKFFSPPGSYIKVISKP
jgi:hypothetical protein